MSEEEERHIRRKRYRGTHPRAFSEKYKELDPTRYAEDVEKVLARGDTPAGTHRSIMVPEILEALAPSPGETAVDATLGYGGHAGEILKRILPGGRLYGFDRDPLELEKTTARLLASIMQPVAPLPTSSLPPAPPAFIPVLANFATISDYFALSGLGGIDIFLADLGLSSMQIDDPSRGFSFKQNGPLDMRMDTGGGRSARDFLAGVSEEALCDILAANADEAQSEEIARAICLRRGRLSTTRDLAEAICSVFPDLAFKDPQMTKTLRRCFQAIRIEVNGEFSSLETLLASLPAMVKPGGRVAILSFHSGEDKRVEAAFFAGLVQGLYSSVSSEAIRPGREERYGNPRSTAAKLRWAIRS
ncbi:MAG: 16S rRNA (cytosine(1402)-N(4))-methyltransferase RsmH [Rectinemataceae bacterium]|nr:16S rRNA (cytosine(1402)-N(4))-methyltransferase RsmH [Rectinemataceae bacterium]